MLGFIAIIGIIILFVRLSDLTDRIKKIEQSSSFTTVQQKSSIPQTPQVEGNVLSDVQKKEELISPVQTINQLESKQIPQTDVFTDFGNWFKQNWLLKTGVLLILIGFGWFISYAFIHNWIGPVGKVTLGFGVGSIIALFGALRMEKNKTQGVTFLILGSALVIITSYAARLVYDFFTPTVALAIVFLVSTYISLCALLFKTRSLAIYGLLIAYVAPLLTHGAFDVKLLFTYLALVSVASIWVAIFREWREINAISLVGFILFSLPYISGIQALVSFDKIFVSAIIFIMGFIYFMVSVLGIIYTNTETEQSDVVVAIFDSVLLILATIAFIPKELQSLTLTVIMLLFAFGSFAVFSKTQKIQFFYVYALISIALLAIATAIELDGPALIYAYILESSIISIAGYIITRKIDVGYILSLFMIGPVCMSLPSIVSTNWSYGIFHDDFGILCMIGIVLSGLGLFYYYSDQEKKKYGDVSTSKAYGILGIIGSLFFLILIWLCAGALLERAVAIFVSLVMYTIIGISTYFYGLTADKAVIKHYGTALLVFVIFRLLLIDIWSMQTSAKVITFISIGVLFISTAFIGKKVKDDLIQ
jgi:uncharacterized membrane protein